MRSLLSLAAALLLALPTEAGQDFQLWSQAGVQVKLAKKWRCKFDGHLRLDRNLTAIDSLMPELALNFRPAKFLRLEAGFRYIAEPIESQEDTYVESWYRFFGEAELRHRLGQMKLRYRLRLDEEFGWPWTKDEKLTVKHTVRNLLGAELELSSSLAPFLSGELFLRLHDPDGALHKWRLSAGLDLTSGRHTFSLYYRLEEPLGDSQDPTRHILGTGYQVDF